MVLELRGVTSQWLDLNEMMARQRANLASLHMRDDCNRERQRGKYLCMSTWLDEFADLQFQVHFSE